MPDQERGTERRKGILLGAGASVAAGLPTSMGMANLIRDTVRSSPAYVRSGVSSALDFAHLAIVHHNAGANRGTPGIDPAVTVDVERLFSAVTLLSERADHEATPFVDMWDPHIDQFGRPGPHPFDVDRYLRETAAALNRDLAQPRRPLRVQLTSLSMAFTQAVRSITGGDIANVYPSVLRAMIEALPAVLAITQDLAYLDPIFDLARRQGSLSVTTLNYDRTIELRGGQLQVEVATGLTDGSVAGQLDWPSDGLRLLKLHGSVDWRLVDRGLGMGYMPELVVSADDTASPGGQLAVVLGERGKLRAEGPFLHLFRRFEDDLAGVQELVVVGYSFRDDHVNELVRRWINDDATRRLVIVDPGLVVVPAYYAAPTFATQLFQRCGPNSPNPRVSLIPEEAKVGLVEALGS